VLKKLIDPAERTACSAQNLIDPAERTACSAQKLIDPAERTACSAQNKGEQKHNPKTMLISS